MITFPNKGYGDGNLDFIFGIMISFYQMFMGLVVILFLSMILSVYDKKINKHIQVGIFTLVNSPFSLWFIYVMHTVSNDYKCKYIPLISVSITILILCSFIYRFLLRKYFKNTEK